MPKRRPPVIGTIRGRGKAKVVWDGTEWIPFRTAFTKKLLVPAEHGKLLAHSSYGGACNSPAEYTVHVHLWQVGDFYVVTDDSGFSEGVFDSYEEACARYDRATEVESGHGDDEEDFEDDL